MKMFVKINAENEVCKIGKVIEHSDGAYLLKVAVADDCYSWLGSPYYRLYGEKFVEAVK